MNNFIFIISLFFPVKKYIFICTNIYLLELYHENLIRIAEMKEKTIENICCFKQKRSNSYDYEMWSKILKTNVSQDIITFNTRFHLHKTKT